MAGRPDPATVPDTPPMSTQAAADQAATDVASEIQDRLVLLMREAGVEIPDGAKLFLSAQGLRVGVVLPEAEAAPAAPKVLPHVRRVAKRKAARKKKPAGRRKKSAAKKKAPAAPKEKA